MIPCSCSKIMQGNFGLSTFLLESYKIYLLAVPASEKGLPSQVFRVFDTGLAEKLLPNCPNGHLWVGGKESLEATRSQGLRIRNAECCQ